MLIPEKSKNSLLKRCLMSAVILLSRRLIVIAVLVITGIVLLILILIEKDDVLVQIELTARSISFDFLGRFDISKSECLERGVLFRSLSADVIAQFTHFEEFAIPFAKVEVATGDEFHFEPLERREAGKMMVKPDDPYSSIIFEKIGLSELRLQRGTRVTLTVPRDDRSVKIVVDGPSTEGKIRIGETLLIECKYCKLDGINDQREDKVKYFRIFSPTWPEEIGFRGERNLLIISIMELSKEIGLSEESICVENVSFLEGSGRYRQTSFAEPGRIILKDFKNREIKIEPHDFVEIGDSRKLQVTRIEFQNDAIKLVFAGRIDELKTATKNGIKLVLIGEIDEHKTRNKYGDLKDPSSQLPSLLGWIYNKQRLFLFLSVLVPVVASICKILRWLGIIPKE